MALAGPPGCSASEVACFRLHKERSRLYSGEIVKINLLDFDKGQVIDLSTQDLAIKWFHDKETPPFYVERIRASFVLIWK